MRVYWWFPFRSRVRFPAEPICFFFINILLLMIDDQSADWYSNQLHVTENLVSFFVFLILG